MKARLMWLAFRTIFVGDWDRSEELEQARVKIGLLRTRGIERASSRLLQALKLQ